MIPANGAPHDLEAREVLRSLSFAQRRARDNGNQIGASHNCRPSTTFTRSISLSAASRPLLPPILPLATNDLIHRSDGYWPLRLACPNCLGLEQLAVLPPPPSAGGNHSVSGHVYTSALSEDASLHQQRHGKKVCLAAAYRKSSCTANSPQYLSTRIDPEELPVESPSYLPGLLNHGIASVSAG
jgi:hypothetical protein